MQIKVKYYLFQIKKGRDVISCFIQLKDISMKYDYLYHFPIKKHDYNELLENIGKFI